jgi:hypothetical protein
MFVISIWFVSSLFMKISRCVVKIKSVVKFMLALLNMCEQDLKSMFDLINLLKRSNIISIK